jgi:hypothetical protein
MSSAHLPHRFSRTARWFAGLTLLATFMGCSKSSPVGPAAAVDPAVATAENSAMAGFGSGTFYPLQTGNHWAYEGDAGVAIVDAEGATVCVGVAIHYTESHTILGTEHRDGRVYFVREQVRSELTGPNVDTWTDWSRMRQDRSGLFAANIEPQPPTLDGVTTVAGASASREVRPLDLSMLRARGFSEEGIAKFAARVERLRAFARTLVGASAGRQAESDELVWLLYPLRPGAEWNMVPGLDWPARVDRIETLDTPAGQIHAYRIETNPTGEPLKPGEYVRLWYGRTGFIGYSVHTSGADTDSQGNPTGLTAIFDDSMLLTGYELGL